MRRFEAVLFDFDGVIVNSTPIHLDGWVAAHESQFGTPIPQEILATLPGQSTAAIAGLLTARLGRGEAAKELIRQKARYVLDHLEKIPLIDGAGDFMQRLREAGIPYGIASNAPRGFIAAALARHGLESAFYLGLEDYAFPKPHPEAYLQGAQRLGWGERDRSRIAVFEDSAHGIQAALGAGATPIGVSSQHPEELLRRAGAVACITDFRESEFLREAFF